MASLPPSTSTAGRTQRLTKTQAMDLMQRLLEEEHSKSSDDSDLELSDNDVGDQVDSDVYQPPAAKKARLNGKGKGPNNKVRTKTVQNAAVANESESDSDNSNVIVNSSAIWVGMNFKLEKMFRSDRPCFDQLFLEFMHH